MSKTKTTRISNPQRFYALLTAFAVLLSVLIGVNVFPQKVFAATSFTGTTVAELQQALNAAAALGASAPEADRTVTLTSNFTIQNGETLNVVQDSILNIGTNVLTVNNGGTLITGGSRIAISNSAPVGLIQINCGGTLDAATISISAGLNHTGRGLVFNVAAGKTRTFNGVISGAGRVTKTGAGTLILTGNSTMTNGRFALNGGTVQMGTGGTKTPSANSRRRKIFLLNTECCGEH